ncbi:MAG: FtsX-like permease family protein [Acidobacteria bacterium]|nr:FtsX-like permease family protein [Acidobacteriota bacterium]
MAVPGDLRRALRSLAGRRAFAATVVLTLALAFSIPAVVLSTVDRHFWRPLDLADSERLFTLQLRFDDGRFSPLSHPEYLQLRAAGAQAFSLATFGPFDFTLVAGGAPTRVNVALVSGNFFTVLGAAPAHGRLLAPPDDDPAAAAAVAVVSHRAWTSQFGRDPELVGRTVRLGPQAFTVVGIAANPLPGPAHEPDFWVPVSALSQLLPDSAGILLGPAARWLHTVGRLFPSTSRGDAAVLAALAKARLPADVAAARTEDWRFVARPLNHARLGPEYHREATRFLTLLVLITGIFLLAACSNLVLLLLTRGAEQAHELAVRRALGASRLALVRPFAAEMLVLVGAGVLAASMALRWVGPVVSTLPQLAPLGPAVSLDTGVVLWMLAVAGAAWVIVCLGVLLMTAGRPPALPAAPNPRVTGRGGRQAALVAMQVAVSGVLVVAAGLLLRSAHGVASTPPGFVPRDILVAQLHTAGYAAAEGHVLYRRLLDELRTGGLVTSAALGWHTPLSVFQLSVAVETPGTSMEVSGNVVSGDYFRTLGIAVLEGREFTSEDRAESAPVAVVNRTLAERLWPGRTAVGRVLAFPRSGGDRTVIGVVDDVRYGALAEPARPLAYLPLAQRFFPRVFIHARAPANPGVMLQHVRRVLADLDPAAPLSDVSTLSERVEESLDRWRAPALLSGLLALVTLILAMAGLYGVLMLAVGQRTRELAIRVALGARETSVRRMVLGQGMRLVAAGALVGLAAAVPLMRLLASQLYGVAPHDAATLGVSLVVLLAAGGLACDLPARRAVRLDTAAALRNE